MENINNFIWESEVRGYELDLQGIVNNANYLHYFDHTRVKHLLSKGIDWNIWHQKGYDLVVVHVDLHFRASLIANDKFYVTSEISRTGKLRVIFQQKIFRLPDHKLIAEATNTTVCLSTHNRRPVMPEELIMKLFDSPDLNPNGNLCN